MKLQTRSILTAAALAATLAASSAGANQDGYFEQQRQLTDGGSQFAAVPQGPNSAQANQGGYLEQQMQLTDGASQIDVPTRAASTKPATAQQITLSKWFELERARNGNVLPKPVPTAANAALGSVATASASRP